MSGERRGQGWMMEGMGFVRGPGTVVRRDKGSVGG